MKKYKPNPIDLSNVTVSKTILDLLDTLAENTHETWAKKRMNEGWTYGAALDGNTKKHPSLVPYQDLSEAEKEYDRATSLETIKMLLQLGYVIGERETE